MSEHSSTVDDSVAAPVEDNRIKVVCRVRPPVARETHGSKGLSNRCVAVNSDKRTVTLSSRPIGKSFTFDYAANEGSTQEELFAEVGKPVTEACLEGYNGTIFCYGQTGSGKTFTTFGPGAVMENHLKPSDPESYALRGLVPRVLEFLYGSIARRVEEGGGKVKYSCRCSFYEIFNEKVFDLVDESNRDNPMGLTVREDTRKGVYVEGLMEEEVDGVDSACEVLHRGFRNRHVGETAMNRESSRSHAVFTLVIHATEVVEDEGLTRSRIARFNLVDLAGSERQKDTQASGERLKEASNINKSLSTLGQVINALVEKSAGRFRHVHYRDSKLTFLLRDSLGGNSKTMLVAAISPADQNFGETLSTLKFAQRAKMIKNQAVKNEDTSGSFDALRREVTTLRQRLAAAQQNADVGDGGSSLPLSLGRMATPGAGAEDAGLLSGAHATSTDALLGDALRRARSAEAAQAGARRRVEALLGAVEKGEKDALQLKMVIKFRDGTIAAQRKKDADKERMALAEENAHLRKQLEGGAGDSSEVSKWRLQCKEAEARLAEITGDKSGNASRLVWGVADEERFRSDLDDKVLRLMEENRQLREDAEGYEESLLHETRKAEKRRLSAENRAEFEAKKIVENALLSKLRDAQGQAEATRHALVLTEERAAALEMERARQEAAMSALTKQLQDANRRVTEAVQDRDVRLGDLQSQIEELSRAKERAVEDSGSEVASLELKLATAIKDNSELLKANKALEEEADSLDQDLERMETEKRTAEEHACEERVEAAAAIAGLEQRMQQQQQAHEREADDLQLEKRSVMRDMEAATERFDSAEKARRREMEEQQRRNSDLQERLVETRAQEEQLEGSLRQLQDDYETLTEQARFSQDRSEELERTLQRAADDLRRATCAGVARACVAHGAFLKSCGHAAAIERQLLEAQRRAEGEEFFKLAQAQRAAHAEELCAEREQTVSLLEEELEAAKGYAEAVRVLVLAHEEQRGVHAAFAGGVGEEEAFAAAAARAEASVIVEAREVAASAGLVQSMLEEHEGAARRIEELEEMVEGLEEDGRALRSEAAEIGVVCEAVSEKLRRLETVHADAQQELASARGYITELEHRVAEAQSSAAEAGARALELDDQVDKLGGTCCEYQARAVAAEGQRDEASAEVRRLADELERCRLAAGNAAREASDAEAAATARQQALLAVTEASRNTAAAREQETAAKSQALAAVEETLERRTAEAEAAEVVLREERGNLRAAREEADGLRRALERAESSEAEMAQKVSACRGEAEAIEERLAATREELSVVEEEVAARRVEVASTRRELAVTVEKVGTVEAALEEARGEIEDAREVECQLREASSAAEARLSIERAARANAETLAAESEALKLEVEENLAVKRQQLEESKQQTAELKQNARDTAEQLEESEAVRKELTARVVDLKAEVKHLEESIVSDEERASLRSDLESAEQQLAEAQNAVATITSRNAILEEELRAMHGETEGYTAKVMELKDVNASLVGHKNSKQRIQQVQKLKDENNLLTRKVKELDDRLFAIKRSGYGPGCGRLSTTASAGNTTGTESESSSTAATSPTGSKHSASPPPARRGGSGGVGGDGGGSAGKTYNLRRRAKIVEGGAGGPGTVPGLANTRGRRMGLRDLTNAH